MATERLETILAQARQLSTEELALLIKQATDLLLQSGAPVPTGKPSYVSLFGSGKGSFATREEADRFIREERDAWAE
jgi:hypothetical protein